jgi:hypothetical protein
MTKSISSMGEPSFGIAIDLASPAPQAPLHHTRRTNPKLLPVAWGFGYRHAPLQPPVPRATKRYRRKSSDGRCKFFVEVCPIGLAARMRGIGDGPRLLLQSRRQPRHPLSQRLRRPFPGQQAVHPPVLDRRGHRLIRCNHGTKINADHLPDETRIRPLGARMVCSSCGHRGARPACPPVARWPRSHGNQSQRFVGCAISAVSATSIDAKAPPDGTYAPPGWYLLFLVDGGRVPSVARWIRLH